MNRRALLAGVGSVSTAAALFTLVNRGGSESPDNRSAPATGPPITVRRTVEREDVEYLPSEEAVRYVAYRVSENSAGVDTKRDDSGRSPVYETVDFARWAAAEGAHAGADAVRNVVESGVSGPLDPLAVSVVDGDGGLYLAVNLVTVLDRSGSVVFESSADFGAVVAAAPDAVTATIELAANAATNTFDVVVEEETMHQQ